MSNPDNKPNLYAMFFTNQFHSFPRCFSGEHLAVEKTLREFLTSRHHIFCTVDRCIVTNYMILRNLTENARKKFIL